MANDKKEYDSPKKQSQLKSFAVAFHGLKVVFLNERNFRFHLLIGILVIIAGFFFQVTVYEWIALLLMIAIVLCAEVLNTSIEYLCDFVSPEYHPSIKKIKDVAAAAVLLCAIISIIVGCIIFFPYLINLL